MDDQDQHDESQAEDLGLNDFSHPDEEQGLSLDQLSEAYAQLLDGGADPYDKPEPEAEETETAPAIAESWDEEEEAAGQAYDVSPISILEALLFVGSEDNRPLSNKLIASLMRGVSPTEIDELVVELNEDYKENSLPYEVTSVGSGYTMALREEYDGLRERFYGRIREARLSQAAIDVLSVVAYNEPIDKTEVDRLRGRPSSALLNQLVRRDLLRMERHERRSLYSTTPRFLELFGLGDIGDLPRSQDLDRNM